MTNEKTPKERLLAEWKELRRIYEWLSKRISPRKSFIYPESDPDNSSCYYNFTHISQLIDISDLDEKINSLTNEEINSPEIWKKLAPTETHPELEKLINFIEKPREFRIADQIANTILARSLILQNRLYEGINKEYEKTINNIRNWLLRCPYMEPAKKEWKNRTQEQVDHYTAKNLELYNKVLNGDPELINRIKDLPWIKLPEHLLKDETNEPEKKPETTKPKPAQKEDNFFIRNRNNSRIITPKDPETDGGQDIHNTEPETTETQTPEAEQSDQEPDTKPAAEDEKEWLEKKIEEEKAKQEQKKAEQERQRQEKEQQEREKEKQWLAKPTLTLQDLEKFKQDYQAKQAKEQQEHEKRANQQKKLNKIFLREKEQEGEKQQKEINSPSPLITTTISTYVEPEKRKPLKLVKYPKPKPTTENNFSENFSQKPEPINEQEPRQEPENNEQEPEVPEQNNINTEPQEPETENPQPNQEPQETEPQQEPNNENNPEQSPSDFNKDGEGETTQPTENNNQNPGQQENQSQQGSNWFSSFSIPKKAAWAGTIGLGSCLFFAAGLISIPVMLCGLFVAAAPVVLPAIAPGFVQPIQNLIIIIIALWILYKIIKKIFKKKE